MGLDRIGVIIGKEMVAWTKTGESLLATKPIKINTCGLKYAPKANVDELVIKQCNLSGFSSKEEIIQCFKNLDINVRIEDFSPRHIETFNLIRNDVETLRRMGLKEAVPSGICMSDWRNIEKTEQLCSEYGINFSFPPTRRAYCGNNTSNTVFINSSEDALESSNGVFRKFKHEIGHRRHYTYYASDGTVKSNGANSVLGQGVCDNLEFANRQLKVLGIDGRVAVIKTVPYPYQLTMPFSGRFIPLEGGKILQIDISKMTSYMNKKCRCYNKEYLSEQVAEIFEDLLKGRRYDDLTMLMYDFAGGGRIPNLVINGLKYDDYIKSLYKNTELVNRLKEFITVS